MIKKLLCTLGAMMAVAGYCYGVAAYPWPLKVKQADGSTITIRLRGDEYCHWTTTADGYDIVSGADGNYYYAEQLFDGTTRASKHKAGDPSQRNAETRQYLQGKAKNIGAQSASVKAAMARARRAIPAEEFDPTDPAARSVATRTTGAINSLVILAKFPNQDFASPSTAQADFTQLVSGTGGSAAVTYGGGSAKKYFQDISNGLYQPNFTVVGPVMLPENSTYYGANDSNGRDERPQQMAADAISAAASLVNFADYAVNGKVPSVFIFYADKGEADGGGEDTIWPHAYSLSSEMNLNGVTLSKYACTSELSYFQDISNYAYGQYNMASIGTFCHEHSHTLGLPDFYDTDYDDHGYSIGLHTLSLMSYGNYNYDGIVPAGFTCVERFIAGWLGGYTNLNTMAGSTVTMRPLATAFEAYMLPTEVDQEFYYFENRQNSYIWDRYVGGSGMVVYHYDKSNNKVSGTTYTAATLWSRNEPNAYKTHECMYMLSTTAGGRNFAYADRSDVDPTVFFFPGAKNVRSLSAITYPARMVSWAGYGTGFALSDITVSGENITFKVSASDDPPPPEKQVLNTTIAIGYSYKTSDNIELKVKTPGDAPQDVVWFVDGDRKTQTSLKLDAGEHTIKAVCTFQDEHKEIMVRYVKVVKG